MAEEHRIGLQGAALHSSVKGSAVGNGGQLKNSEISDASGK